MYRETDARVNSMKSIAGDGNRLMKLPLLLYSQDKQMKPSKCMAFMFTKNYLSFG